MYSSFKLKHFLYPLGPTMEDPKVKKRTTKPQTKFLYSNLKHEVLKEFQEFSYLLLLYDTYSQLSQILYRIKNLSFRLLSWQEWSRWNWIFLIGYNSIWMQEVGQSFIINHYINSNLTFKEISKINTSYIKCRDQYFNKNKKADVWTDVRSKCSSCIKYEI